MPNTEDPLEGGLCLNGGIGELGPAGGINGPAGRNIGRTAMNGDAPGTGKACRNIPA